MIRRICSILAALCALIAVQHAGAGFLINSFLTASTPATIAFGDCQSSATDLQTYSFTLNTGTAGANRHTLITVFGDDSATVYNVTGVTVGGDAATEVADEGGVGTANAAIYILANPAGTSETVEVTFSEIITTAGACAFAAYDLQSQTAFAATTDDDTASGALVLNLNTPADGIAVGGCTTNTAQTFTWTGFTERADAAEAAQFSYSAADFDEDGTGATPLSVTCDPTGTNDASGASASFR